MLRETRSLPQENPWLLSVSSDEVQVAEMLMRLSQPQAQSLFPCSSSSSLPGPPPALAMEMLPLEWGLRQRRSRQVARCGCNYEKKAGAATAAVASAAVQKANTGSPTTPLSWSGTTGGASFSGGGVGGGVVGGAVGGSGGDGSDSSSRCVKPATVAGGSSSGGRIKVAAREANQCRIPSRRVSKKRTLIEWREEANALSMEKIDLEKELERAQKRYRELKDKNESLKKLEINLRHAKKTPNHPSAVPKELSQESCLPTEAVSADHTSAVLPSNTTWVEHVGAEICSAPLPDSPKIQEANVNLPFKIPDLNMPLEEDSGAETLHGIS